MPEWLTETDDPVTCETCIGVLEHCMRIAYVRGVIRSMPRTSTIERARISVDADDEDEDPADVDPETSDTGKWERIAFVNLRSRDVDGDAAETSGSVLGRQLAARLADLREGLLAVRPIEMMVADVEASGQLEGDRSRCKVDGCRGRVSVKHGRGETCYARRARATGE